MIEELFSEHDIQYEVFDINKIDYRIDKNIYKIRKSSWFWPTHVFRICDEETNKKHVIYVTMHRHVSRLDSEDPHNVARWIEEEIDGLYTVISKKDDIIAYYSGTPLDIIEQILERCN